LSAVGVAGERLRARLFGRTRLLFGWILRGSCTEQDSCPARPGSGARPGAGLVAVRCRALRPATRAEAMGVQHSVSGRACQASAQRAGTGPSCRKPRPGLALRLGTAMLSSGRSILLRSRTDLLFPSLQYRTDRARVSASLHRLRWRQCPAGVSQPLHQQCGNRQCRCRGGGSWGGSPQCRGPHLPYQLWLLQRQ
jgi:hypothetical protein